MRTIIQFKIYRNMFSAHSNFDNVLKINYFSSDQQNTSCLAQKGKTVED